MILPTGPAIVPQREMDKLYEVYSRLESRPHYRRQQLSPMAYLQQERKALVQGLPKEHDLRRRVESVTGELLDTKTPVKRRKPLTDEELRRIKGNRRQSAGGEDSDDVTQRVQKSHLAQAWNVQVDDGGGGEEGLRHHEMARRAMSMLDTDLENHKDDPEDLVSGTNEDEAAIDKDLFSQSRSLFSATVEESNIPAVTIPNSVTSHEDCYKFISPQYLRSLHLENKHSGTSVYPPASSTPASTPTCDRDNSDNDSDLVVECDADVGNMADFTMPSESGRKQTSQGCAEVDEQRKFLSEGVHKWLEADHS